MLAEKVVENDEGGDGLVLVDRADADGGDVGAGVDLPQILLGGRIDIAPERRELRDAALKIAAARRLLADAVDLGDLQFAFARILRRTRDAEAAHHAEETGREPCGERGWT